MILSSSRFYFESLHPYEKYVKNYFVNFMTPERQNNRHYSDKGGHHERSEYWKSMSRVEKEIARGLVRHMRRVPNSGKR